MPPPVHGFPIADLAALAAAADALGAKYTAAAARELLRQAVAERDDAPAATDSSPPSD